MEDITDYLKLNAEKCPNKKVFVYLEDGETETASLTFAELYRAVKVLSSTIGSGRSGEHALLLYENVMEFITAFTACQYSGLTAVPMFFPKGKRHFERLELVLRDSGSQLVLCEKDQYGKITEGFSRIGMESVTILATAIADLQQPVQDVSVPKEMGNHLSFIQYTSGSTGTPKGVLVSHRNLLHNQQLIGETFGCNDSSVILSWLPFYHDMGLVGNLLHAIYTGCTCILMSPYAFMQSPVRWFRAIARYKVTHSGGPNFAYDLCTEKIKEEEAAGLDLSSWQIAYNGSEPVSKATINRFINKFADSGFKASAMFPCYGLAEATLLVSGGHFYENANTTSVSGGQVVNGMEAAILNPETGKHAADGEEGEICLYGESVTEGYWGKDNKELFATHNSKHYLKTGDLGLLRDGELFITGRIKEMIIINGQNHFPYDIERTVFKTFNQIEPNGVVVFSAPDPADGIVVVAELKREFVLDKDLEGIIRNVFLELVSSHVLTPFDVVLVKPRYLPRTSSGKLQRLKCREQYSSGQLEMLSSRRLSTQPDKTPNPADQVLFEKIRGGSHPELIHQYLTELISSKVGFRLPDTGKQTDIELTEIGIDSIKAMEIINSINKDLEINLVASAVFQENRYAALVEQIENLLWLKSTKSGEEIVI